MFSPERSQAGPSDRLKVLIYTSLFPNSVQPILGNFVMERMRHLHPLADLSVVAPVPYFPRLKISKRWYEFSRIPREEHFAGFEVDHPRFLVLPKMGMAAHGLSMLLGSLKQVSRNIRQTSCDVIDAHYVYPDGFAAVLLGSLLNKPVVISARGSDINLFPKFATIRPLIRFVLKRADAVIAVSPSLKDAMMKLGCPGEKISVIANGIDSVKFQPRCQSEMRQALELPEGRPIALSVGKLTENKGFHILIEAVAQLRSKRSDLLLVIVGEGPYRPHLERKIREFGLNEAVRLVGSQPHEKLCAWYSAANVFCLASGSEGCPNVVMEAMACGLPVITTNAGGSIVTSSSLGILVEREPAEFRTALDQALDRKWDHDGITAHARSQGWDRVAEKVFNLFSEVVARRDPRRARTVINQAS